jgi:ATP-dependent Clp protease ATP-binding subunit ClpA
VAKIKEEFGSALLGRIKNVCLFNPLTISQIEKIIQNRVAVISAELNQSRQFSLSPDANFLQALARESFDADTGARSAEQLTEKILNDLIIAKISEGKSGKKMYKLTKEKEYRMI